MKKLYYFGAKWREKDLLFLNGLNLIKIIEKGYDSFSIEEGETYYKIIEHFSRKDPLLGNTRPKDFYSTLATVLFSKQELDKADKYMLQFTGESKGDPLPIESFEVDTYPFDCNECWAHRKQIAPFRIGKLKWKKGQVNFTLRYHDVMFFKKEFYQEVLKPFGLNYIDVIEHSTGEISKDVIQLDVPEAKSPLLINDSAYDTEEPCKVCGRKQYTMRTMDFFPPFEEEFKFSICRTQEEFGGGLRRMIITKEFCDLLVQHKIIKYDMNNIAPMKNSLQ